jgi:hypothetical protein
LECIKRNIPTEPNKCTKLVPAYLVEDWTVFSVNTIQVPCSMVYGVVCFRIVVQSY